MTTTAIDPELLQRGGLALDVDGPRATITLARPEVLNAQTPLTWEALRSIGESLPADVRVVVVRGSGRAFSAGLDKRFFAAPEVDGQPGISGLAALSDEEADATIATFQSGFSWLRDPTRVTVAAVQGHAIGAGFQLALACDRRVVAEEAVASGLALRAVPVAELDAAVDALVASLLTAPPQAATETLGLLAGVAEGADPAAALAAERAAQLRRLR